MKYKIIFKHLVEQEYTAFVDAESKELAKDKFREDPFNYSDCEIQDECGLDITIDSINEEE